MWISKRYTISGSKFEIGSTRGLCRLGSGHVVLGKKVMSILGLIQEESFGGSSNMENKEIMKTSPLAQRPD